MGPGAVGFLQTAGELINLHPMSTCASVPSTATSEARNLPDRDKQQVTERILATPSVTWASRWITNE